MGKYSLADRPRVFLKKGKTKPFWFHHPWVFAGAVKNIKGEPENGDIVDVFDVDNRFIGKGFINFDSQIRVRLLSWQLKEKINETFFTDKLCRALALREKILDLPKETNAYRLVHGEGDGLPGLVIDRYHEYLCVQFLSVGMDKRRDMILAILKKITGLETIVERYPARYRVLEGLEEIDYRVHGPMPPEKIQIQENGITFELSLAKGQKTGFYLDQRENRMRISKYPTHEKVLDAFCYSGAFGIYLLHHQKANHVTFMDSSGFALDLLQNNLRHNNIEDRHSIVRGNLFKKLPEMEQSGEKFHLIILDPPKVAPEKSSLQQGIRSLKLLNATAMRMLHTGGMLVTCDCSGLITQNDFWKMLSQAAKDAGRFLQIVEFNGAGLDHPILPSCPENFYLKFAVGIVRD